MAQHGALKPQHYEDIQDIWRKKDQEKGKESGIDPEDQQLHTLYGMPGWQTLKAHIDNMKAGLDTRLAEAVLKSLGAEQIKTDALFCVLGKELLNSIVHKVEDSALVVEQIINEQTEPTK